MKKQEFGGKEADGIQFHGKERKAALVQELNDETKIHSSP